MPVKPSCFILVRTNATASPDHGPVMRASLKKGEGGEAEGLGGMVDCWMGQLAMRALKSAHLCTCAWSCIYVRVHGGACAQRGNASLRHLQVQHLDVTRPIVIIRRHDYQ